MRSWSGGGDVPLRSARDPSRAEIKPHRTEYWMMTDYSRPEFRSAWARLRLDIDPPENVLVVSIDEKTGIQAKAPTKPDQPPQPGKPARREHEYTETAPSACSRASTCTRVTCWRCRPRPATGGT